MKKLLSLLLVCCLILMIVSVALTVFAEETQYTPIDSDFEYAHWGYTFNHEVVKVGDWYYTLYENSYTGEKRIDDVCGYDGTETEITIPTELNGTQITGMDAFCLLSTTVKTIIIPPQITGITPGNEWYEQHSYGPSVYINCEGETKLEEIIVLPGNRSFWSEDGILYSGYYLCFYPPEKKDTEYVMPEDINEICAGAINTQKYLKNLTIGKLVSLIHDNAITPTLKNLYFYTDSSVATNNADYYSGDLYYGVQYMPKVPNGTIYCLDGSEAHEFYKKHGGYCKNLEVLKDELIKHEDGKWYFHRGGLANMQQKQYGLFKFKNKWFYLQKGVWLKKTGIFMHGSKWFYVENGKWEKTTNDLVWYKGKCFYVQDGKWDSITDTLFKKNGKWFAVKSGKWYKGKAIIEYSGKEFYVNKGFVQFKFSGEQKINGNTYNIKNGKVK